MSGRGRGYVRVRVRGHVKDDHDGGKCPGLQIMNFRGSRKTPKLGPKGLIKTH